MKVLQDRSGTSTSFVRMRVAVAVLAAGVGVGVRRISAEGVGPEDSVMFDELIKAADGELH